MLGVKNLLKSNVRKTAKEKKYKGAIVFVVEIVINMYGYIISSVAY